MKVVTPTEVAPGWFDTHASKIPGTGKPKTGAQLDREAAVRRAEAQKAA